MGKHEAPQEPIVSAAIDNDADLEAFLNALFEAAKEVKEDLSEGSEARTWTDCAPGPGPLDATPAPFQQALFVHQAQQVESFFTEADENGVEYLAIEFRSGLESLTLLFNEELWAKTLQGVQSSIASRNKNSDDIWGEEK